GITIDTAINGLDAVHKVAQSEEGFYQIILMDIQMPIMDGYEATRQIRSLQRRDIAHMPIIAMTANAFSEDVTNAIKAGMNYHLAKPIDIGALMGILSKYLQAPA
ncbi:MAG: response regulator, partial [Parabacteroides distasonis]